MKLLVIRSAAESKWGSCKVISPNLHELYKRLDSTFEVKWFDLPEDIMKRELGPEKSSCISSLVKELTEYRPDRLVFVDHLPPPPTVIAYLSLQLSLKRLPPMVFHIYGDFSYFSKEWNYLSEVFESHPMTFIAASASQQRFVDAFLNQPAKVSKLCFPVNASEYFFNEEERVKYRQEQSLGKDDFVILYSGRISLQKNVDCLINEFVKFKHPTKKPHLWIVGAFDDVGADFLGCETYPGYMFSKIHTQLSFLSEEQRSRIKFFGMKKKEELRKIKAAADFFASFSLYHDEDYGMSPAEALSTGLKSVLTDWGGYSSFASNKDWECALVDVGLDEYGFSLSTSKFQEALRAACEKEDSASERLKRSKAFLNEFSIEGNVENLKKILNEKPMIFSGFNWLLEQYASALAQNWSRSKLNKFLSPKNKSFYFDVYKNYISKLSQESKHE